MVVFDKTKKNHTQPTLLLWDESNAVVWQHLTPNPTIVCKGQWSFSMVSGDRKMTRHFWANREKQSLARFFAAGHGEFVVSVPGWHTDISLNEGPLAWCSLVGGRLLSGSPHSIASPLFLFTSYQDIPWILSWQHVFDYERLDNNMFARKGMEHSLWICLQLHAKPPVVVKFLCHA